MRVILVVSFFLSGLSALIYQVVWLRMLTLVFGVTSYAVATVLSAFMAGLALGSYCGGRFVDKREKPLLIFSVLQFGIGLFALLFPLLYGALTAVYIFIYRNWPMGIYFFSLIRFTLAFGLLLIPTTLMGATLPVLAKFFIRNRSHLGANIGILYSANNWGAVLGGLAAGFVLIEALGVRETSYLAAVISLSIGAVAFLLHRRSSGLPAREALPDEEPATTGAARAYSRTLLWVVLAVFGIEGFTSLAYEVVWTRILASSLIVTTTYAYSLVAGTFIAGLAIGSMLVARFTDSRRDLLVWLGGIEISIGLAAILLMPLFRASDMFARLLGEPGTWWGWIGITVIWLGILMLVPTTLMGATFPIVSKIYTIRLRDLGRCIGKVGCLDTAGSIFGAFAGGFILIPLMGMHKSILFLAAINVSIGIWVLLSHPAMSVARKALITAALLIVTGFAWVRSSGDIIFRPWCLEEGDIAGSRGWHVVDYDEGVESTVTVSRAFMDDAKVLRVDGADVAGTGRPLETTQITQAHLPILIYEAQNGKPPERALTIGLGSGGTSYSLSLHDLKEIHCVELVGGVRRMAEKHFEELNHGVFSDPRYRVFIQDARAFVPASNNKYDVIMDDSVHPGFQGNANLYSRDFFQDCRRSLTDDGVMSVWMPVFLISADDLKMIFRSFCDIFPHATLWRANNDLNKHMVLIGTPERLNIDLKAFCRGAEAPAIRNDLGRVGLDDPFLLLNSLLLDEEALRAYCRNSPPNCDDYPLLTFTCARSFRRYFNNDPWQERVSELRAFSSDIFPYVTNLGDTEDEIAHNRKRLADAKKKARYLDRGFLAVSLGHYNDALQAGIEAMKLDPLDKNARLLLSRSRYAHALIDWRKGMTDKAEKELREIVASNPNYFYAHERLSFVLWRQGKAEEAIEQLEKALERIPGHESRRYLLAGLYARTGRVEEAKRQLQRVLEVYPGEPTVLRKLKELQELERI